MVESEVNESSGLYVDVENLQGDAQELIGSLIQDWPAEVPPPSRIVLYVRADLVTLWEMWALTLAKDKEVEVKGIQHFSLQGSKNSADIAIAVDAVTDLVKGRIGHVAVFSDDSDFIALFTKVKEETKQIQKTSGRVPFLWILTDRTGNKTVNIRNFFPEDYLHTVCWKQETYGSQYQAEPTTQESSPHKSSNSSASEEAIVVALIEELPIGLFKSPACKKIIAKRFPRHPSVKMDGSRFGDYFLKNIWLEIEGRGAKLLGRSPPRYEMTQAAKDSLR
jgi:hypothetical protein